MWRYPASASCAQAGAERVPALHPTMRRVRRHGKASATWKRLGKAWGDRHQKTWLLGGPWSVPQNDLSSCWSISGMAAPQCHACLGNKRRIGHEGPIAGWQLERHISGGAWNVT